MSSPIDGTGDSVGPSPGFIRTVLVTNSISIIACLSILILYIVLWGYHPRLLSRLSLRLSVAMSASDLILHISNLAGYGDLPRGFTCAFVGGMLFALPNLLSLFYACAIAFNCQLIFVFKKQPSRSKQTLFIGLPIFLALFICIPTLSMSWYGYDETLGFCWYASTSDGGHNTLLRIIFTYSIWTFISVIYLSWAAFTIIRSVFSNYRRLPQASNSCENSKDPQSAVVTRREAARRALTIRLLGCIFVAIICVIPSVALDCLLKQGVETSDEINAFFTGIQGLMGTANAVLVTCDPAVLAIFYTWKLDRQRRADLKRGVPVCLDDPISLGYGVSPLSQFELGVASHKPSSTPVSGIVVQVEVSRYTDDILQSVEHDLNGL